MSLLNNFDFSLDEDAVSPVVGVILMVAITVILAAVIGTFVLDLGGQVQQNAQAGVTFDETEGQSVTVQLNSVQSADHIYVQGDVNDDKGNWSGGLDAEADVTNPDGPTNSSNGDDSDAYHHYLLSGENGGAGTTVTVDTSGASDGQLSVIGVLDGSSSVIQTYEFVGGA